MASNAAKPSWTSDLTGYFAFVLFTATLGPLLFGYHLAELNAPQKVLTCITASPRSAAEVGLPQCIPMNTSQFAAVSALFTVGGLVGALFSGPITSAYGRLKTMQYNGIFLALGPIAEALAPNVALLGFGRFISGIGAGTAVVVVPIYLSEISPPSKKGFFGAFTQVMTNVGIFITQLLGLFLSHGKLWRIILAVGGIIGICQVAGLFFAVESPKWSAEKGRSIEAKKSLRRVRGTSYDVTEEVDGWGLDTAEEREEEEQALLHNDDQPSTESPPPRKRDVISKASVGIFQVIRHPEYNRAVLAVMVVMVAQQLCGINSIVMYGVALLSDLLPTSSAILNVFVSVVNVVVTLSCAPLVDYLGRKPCLILSILGMGISSLLLAVGIAQGIAILSAVAVLTFIASFSLGLGPVPFILSSELVGPEAVGATQSWALAANWVATFIVSFFFPILNETLGKGRVYYIFAAIAGAAAAFVAWWVPETKGKRDADEVWGRTTNRERMD